MTRVFMPLAWKAIAHDISVGSAICYDSEDPYAVRIEFHDEDKTQWLIGRDLLEDGMDGSAGEGDVLCWSTDDRYFLMLRTPHRSLVISCSLGAMEYFLNQTYAVVPPGHEAVDIANLVERILE